MSVDLGGSTERRVSAGDLLTVAEVSGLIQTTVENGRKDRASYRQENINKLRQDGRKPWEIFDAIIVGRTRADNLSCCYNLEVDHELIAHYLRELAGTEKGKNAETYEFLADLGDGIAKSRSVVTNLMSIDQLTNLANYDRDTFLKSVFDSSLGAANKDATISQRTWHEGDNFSYATELQEARDDIVNWDTLSRQYSPVIKLLIPYIYDGSRKMPSGLKIALLDDTDPASNKFVNALTKNEQWVASCITELVKGIDEKTVFELFENLTFAQQVLEEQYYYLGIGLLRANEIGSLPESVVELIKRIDKN